MVRSFVNDMLVPPLALLMGDRVVNLFLLIRRGRSGRVPQSVEEAAGDGAITVNYGRFLHQVLNFFTVGCAVFYLLRVVKAFFKWRIDMPQDKRTCPHCLSEIPVQAGRCAYCTQVLPPLDHSASDAAHVDRSLITAPSTPVTPWTPLLPTSLASHDK
ncbi:hypothetical protein BC831DRAFT_450915 [Entophlyctis helioformis]|nr:hypothetical protein BC831DRAFT_450915 [Entophlyctis helioformis]